MSQNIEFATIHASKEAADEYAAAKEHGIDPVEVAQGHIVIATEIVRMVNRDKRQKVQ